MLQKSVCCRPPIALANLLAIPMFLHYLKGKRCDFKLCQQILLFLLPYVVIGLLLMITNGKIYQNRTKRNIRKRII